MDGQSTYVDSNGEDWRETPYAGITWKKLFFDKETGRSAVLVRFSPGATYAAHRHPAGEEYYVLEGTISDGGRSWGEGTYVYHPPGSVHRPFSRDGCIVLITLPEQIEVLEEEAT